MIPTPKSVPTSVPKSAPTSAPKSTHAPKKLDDLLDSRLMAKLDAIDVVSRKIFAGKLQGERRSKRRGQSIEFADFRPLARQGRLAGQAAIDRHDAAEG